MTIDFEKIEEKAIPNFKGGEGCVNARIFDDGDAKIMKMRLEPGSSIGTHTHEGNAEVIFILSGNGTHVADGQEEVAKPGMALYCPQGHTHTLRNTGSEPLVFYAVVK